MTTRKTTAPKKLAAPVKRRKKPGRKRIGTRVVLTLGDKTLRKIEAIALKAGTDRNTVIRTACDQYVEQDNA